jgi:hypothetical protein
MMEAASTSETSVITRLHGATTHKTATFILWRFFGAIPMEHRSTGMCAVVCLCAAFALFFKNIIIIIIIIYSKYEVAQRRQQ